MSELTTTVAFGPQLESAPRQDEFVPTKQLAKVAILPLGDEVIKNEITFWQQTRTLLAEVLPTHPLAVAGGAVAEWLEIYGQMYDPSVRMSRGERVRTRALLAAALGVSALLRTPTCKPIVAATHLLDPKGIGFDLDYREPDKVGLHVRSDVLEAMCFTPAEGVETWYENERLFLRVTHPAAPSAASLRKFRLQHDVSFDCNQYTSLAPKVKNTFWQGRD